MSQTAVTAPQGAPHVVGLLYWHQPLGDPIARHRDAAVGQPHADEFELDADARLPTKQSAHGPHWVIGMRRDHDNLSAMRRQFVG